MGSKLLAIGVGKYIGDKMNYIDGTVVILSVVEMVIDAVLSGDGAESISNFESLKILRAFRVFRIGRLLRALESMQTIIHVMVNSYKSFIYIIVLMFLFIYIFALLGVEVFGGNLKCSKWVACNEIEEYPRSNYNDFTKAFNTVF